MNIQQIKILCWRNIILKKRSIISTLMEIILPTLIILFIALSSGEEEQKLNHQMVQNDPPISYADPKSYYDKVGQIDINFVFSPSIEKQYQNIFIENFKKNKILKDFTLLDADTPFTNRSEYYLEQIAQLLQDMEKEKYQRFNPFLLPDPTSSFHSTQILRNSTSIPEKIIIDSTMYESETLHISPPKDKDQQQHRRRDELPTTTNATTANDKDITTYEYKISIVDSKEKMMDRRISHSKLMEDYKFIGVVFDTPTNYTIYSDISSELKNFVKLSGKELEHLYSEYYLKDFFNIQVMVDHAIIYTLFEQAGSTPTFKDYEISTKKMDLLGYVIKYKENVAHDDVPALMLFYFVPCICTLLNHLVIEKESRLRESLQIVGLKSSSFWISWILIYGVIIMLTSLCVTVAMYYFKLFVFVHWSVTIVMMMIYGLSCCSLSFILAAFINKSKTAYIVGGLTLAYFIMVLIVYIVIHFTAAQYVLNLILSPIAFLTLFHNLLKIETKSLNVTLFNMFKYKEITNSFFALVFCFILYFAVASYLNSVIPQGNNLHKKWHSFITDSFHQRNRRLDQDLPDPNQHNTFIQPNPTNQKLAVEVKNIGRTFRIKREKLPVLNHISFNVYYDEIFAILGHNGAGKTTLLNIMTGILSANQGEVYYDGVPLSGNETNICQDFGYCPQFEALNQSLTVGEHVRLIAGIKNVKVNVDQELGKLDLLEKKNNYPSQLSGGQKRKLSVILALIGNPRFVFLDEPTTGLDPYSRKKVWELLSQRKKGHVTFITTHYMDEADLLADRKMILSSGTITCLGSSLFLKNNFNMNYTLNVQTESVEAQERVDAIIRTYHQGFWQSKKTRKARKSQWQDSEMSSHSNATPTYMTTYALPMTLSKSFKDIFDRLNQLIKEDQSGVKNYSLTAPTLEDLFIRLENHDPNNKRLQRIMKKPTVFFKAPDKEEEEMMTLDQVFRNRPSNQPSSYQQISSIVRLRFKTFFKSKTFPILYIFVPALLIFICMYYEKKLLNQLTSIQSYNALEMNPTLYNDGIWVKDTTSTPGLATDILNALDHQQPHPPTLQALDYEQALTIDSKNLTATADYIGGFKGTETLDQQLHFMIYYNATDGFALPVSFNLLSNAILHQQNRTEEIAAKYQPFDSALFQLYDDDDKYQVMNLFSENIKRILEPGIIAGIAMAISLPLCIYGPLTVKEREEGILHQLHLNGTKRRNYWIAVFISDTLCTLIPVGIVCLVSWIEGVTIFQLRLLPLTLFIMLIWVIASLHHQYVLSYFFKKYERISSILMVVNPILILVFGIYTFIVSDIVNLYNLEDDSKNEKYERVFSIYFIALILLYTPVSLVIYLVKMTSCTLKDVLLISLEDIDQFIASAEGAKIMNNDQLPLTERHQRLTQKFLDYRLPSWIKILRDHKILIVATILLLLAMVFYIFLLHYLERVKLRRLQKNHPYTPAQRELLDQKLREGPVEVYEEWKRVQQALISSSTSTPGLTATSSTALLGPSSTEKQASQSLEDQDQDRVILDMEVARSNSREEEALALKVYELNKDFVLTKRKKKKLLEKQQQKSWISGSRASTFSTASSSLLTYRKKSPTSVPPRPTGPLKGKGKGNGNEIAIAIGRETKDSADPVALKSQILYDPQRKKSIHRVVEDVSFGVKVGECLGILGPNGAGKTTSISMITGLLSHTHGQVVYGTKDLKETDITDLSLGYCPQQDSLWSNLTVKETIQFYLNICGYPPKAIPRYTQALMEACGIELHAHKRVSEISGGTRRKLSLIVAVCSSPSYLILDEPSAGMDPFTRRYMWKLISELKKSRETAIILTTHSTEEAEALCERLGILIQGRLVCIDTPERIKMNYNRGYTLEVYTNYPQQFEAFVQKNNIFGGEAPESESNPSDNHHNNDTNTNNTNNNNNDNNNNNSNDNNTNNDNDNNNNNNNNNNNKNTKTYNINTINNDNTNNNNNNNNTSLTTNNINHTIQTNDKRKNSAASVYLLESSMNYQKYYVEMTRERLANVFYWMEKAKEKYLVRQYHFGQYSLEQVFLDFIHHHAAATPTDV